MGLPRSVKTMEKGIMLFPLPKKGIEENNYTG
jgi:hypothetical protein